MKPVIVSACLLGYNCRYDGGNCRHQKVIDYLVAKTYLAVCPEELGGLPTPRLPSEINNNQVVDNRQVDVSRQFQSGAQVVLKLAKYNNCELAILKEQSPSCGSKEIYDGSFTGKIIAGQGITTKLLVSQGIRVISEEEL